MAIIITTNDERRTTVDGYTSVQFLKRSSEENSSHFCIDSRSLVKSTYPWPIKGLKIKNDYYQRNFLFLFFFLLLSLFTLARSTR